MTLTLKKAAAGTPVAIGVTRAGDTLKTAVGDFVAVFNELKGQIAAARTATRGDQATRTLDRQLSQLIFGIQVFGQQTGGLGGAGVGAAAGGLVNLPINLDNGRVPLALNALADRAPKGGA